MNNTKFTALTAEEMISIDGGLDGRKIKAGINLIKRGVQLIINGVFHWSNSNRIKIKKLYNYNGGKHNEQH